MTWINIVKKLKTFWSKGKYYIVSIVTGVIAFIIIFCLKKKGDPWKAFDDTQQRHDKELEVIEKTHLEESEKKENEIKTYHKVVETIEKEHKDQNKQLKSQYKKEVKKIVKKYKDEPDELTKKLSEEFGINYTA